MFLPDPKPALYHAPADVYGCGIGMTHSLLSLVALLPSLCLCVCVEWEIILAGTGERISETAASRVWLWVSLMGLSWSGLDFLTSWWLGS